MTLKTAFALSALLLAAPVAAKSKDPIKVVSAKSLQGLQNVVIGSFSIAFVSEKTDAAFAGQQLRGSGSITKSKLAGIAPAEFQAITDAAYADFTARLAAAGITIADRAAMITDKQMAKITYQPSGTEGVIQFGKDSKAKALFYGPSAFGQYALMKGETGTAPAGVTSALGGFGSALAGFSALSGPQASKALYSTYNKQALINVSYVIDYADAKRYGGYFAVQSNVTVKANLAAVETLSTITTLNAKTEAASLTLAEPIAIGGDFGALSDTTTGGQKADNMIGALIGGLAGSQVNNYKYLTFTAQPEQYRAGAVEAATLTNARMVERLVSLR